MRRIADDPDSWGKPADLERKPIATDDSKCPSCGVQWMHHMADLCPIGAKFPIPKVQYAIADGDFGI